MALKPWAQITSKYDLQNYVAAETAEAQAKCAVAYPQYLAAYEYLNNLLYSSSINEATLVANTKAMVESARTIWRANCDVDASAAPLVEASVPDPEAAAVTPSGSGIGKWLLLGAAGVGLYLLLRKKKLGGQTATARANPRRRRRRRR